MFDMWVEKLPNLTEILTEAHAIGILSTHEGPRFHHALDIGKHFDSPIMEGLI